MVFNLIKQFICLTVLSNLGVRVYVIGVGVDGESATNIGNKIKGCRRVSKQIMNLNPLGIQTT